MEIKMNNPFCGRTDGVRFPGYVYQEKDYAECRIVKKVNPLSDTDKTAFDVVEDIEITDIVDRADYINQFVDDVGIINILKKVARTGDSSLVNQCQPGYMDLSNMPEDFLSARAMYDDAMVAYNKIPEEIRKNMTAEEFAKITEENLNKSLNAYVDSLQNKPKEEVKNNE